jgi:hypothetical protein
VGRRFPFWVSRRGFAEIPTVMHLLSSFCYCWGRISGSMQRHKTKKISSRLTTLGKQNLLPLIKPRKRRESQKKKKSYDQAGTVACAGQQPANTTVRVTGRSKFTLAGESPKDFTSVGRCRTSPRPRRAHGGCARGRKGTSPPLLRLRLRLRGADNAPKNTWAGRKQKAARRAADPWALLLFS